jgi:hypothetical protein
MLTFMEMDRSYYVYAHVDSTGRVFYVGKGKGKRAKSKTGRSVAWKENVAKHGRTIRFVRKDMPEVCALSLERAIIHAIGKENLLNMTTGGQGVSGRVPSEEQREKCRMSNKGRPPASHTIEAAIKKTRKMVGTKCGLVFDSITDAAKFVAIDGNVKAAKASISACCRGYRISQCYGYEFRYVVDGELVDSGFSKKIVSIPVKNDAGMFFDGAHMAEKWLRKNGHPKALASNITQSCKIKKRRAYGYKWEYA